jgi:hypothetical protein
MQILRAFGLYLAKDPIFNYRGERNEGTFMGDYAGKIEKKAVVKWTGEKKQRTVLSATKITDEAGRDETVRDYMEFVFNVVNEYPPPARISLRKISILLSYVTIESLEKTSGLAIRYLGQSEPLLTRSVLFKLAKKRTKVAKELASSVFDKDAQISKLYQGNKDLMLQRIFGKEWE